MIILHTCKKINIILEKTYFYAKILYIAQNACRLF